MSSRVRLLVVVVLKLVFVHAAMGQQTSSPAVPPIPIDATEAQVKQAVSLVGG